MKGNKFRILGIAIIVAILAVAYQAYSTSVEEDFSKDAKPELALKAFKSIVLEIIPECQRSEKKDLMALLTIIGFSFMMLLEFILG